MTDPSPLSRLNGTEFLDWQEVWCFRCAHDHDFSHGPQDMADGCALLPPTLAMQPVPEHQLADYVIEYIEPDGTRGEHRVLTYPDCGTIPDTVWCTAFTPCTAPGCNVHVSGVTISGRRPLTPIEDVALRLLKAHDPATAGSTPVGGS